MVLYQCALDMPFPKIQHFCVVYHCYGHFHEHVSQDRSYDLKIVNSPY